MKRTHIAIAAVGALGLTVAAIAAGAKASAAVRGGVATQSLQADEPNRPIANLIRHGIRRLVALNGELNLTEDQRSQIREVVKGHRQEILPVAKDLMSKRQALRQAVLADNPSEQDIRAAADAFGKSVGDAAVLASKVAGEVKPILTEEQKQTLRDFQADRHADMENFIDEQLAK